MNSITATPAPRQRKPRAKPARSIALLVRPTADCTGVVRITSRKCVTDYMVNLMPSDFGRAFRLTKILGEHDGYDVCLSDEGSLCDCKGFASVKGDGGRSCKHVDGLKALINAGKM